MRLILDGIPYVLRTGCAWAHLPREFPPTGTVQRWFLRLARTGTFERMAHALVVEPRGSPDMADRERSGREASPTAAVVDAQAARADRVGVTGQKGYDPARRVVGRKRHALVDTDGRLLLAALSPANLHDSQGGVALLQASRQPWPLLLRCFADRAYAGPRVAGATSIAATLVGAASGQRGFAVQPRRWVIKRSFAWAGRCPRLARDHEATPSPATAFFVLANAMVLVRRLAQPL